MSKILFAYPNKEGYPIIPLGISVLSGILKNAGHETDLFDATFMMSNRVDHIAREESKSTKKVDVETYWGKGDGGDINASFRDKIQSFNPDLIAFSIVENNYGCAKEMFQAAKDVTDSPIIVGGLFPTTMPNYFTEDTNVDIICTGEGENAIKDLANRLDLGINYFDIKNLSVRNPSRSFSSNPLAGYYKWNPHVFQDWDIFDKRHLMKPFMGKMRKTGFFELSRGCPNKCSYCINDANQKVFKGLGRYNRQKSIDSTIEEIVHMKDRHSLELVFFNDEHFLAMGKERLENFCYQYKKDVDLPFFIMTRAERVNRNNLEHLKMAGCTTIGIGVETGNERIRKDLLNKNTPNIAYEKAFDLCREYKIRTTANIMVGLPFETEKNIQESVEFCKRLEPGSISLGIFAPYYGTKLRDICVKNGFIEDIYNENIGIVSNSILNMPQLSKEKIRDYYLNFNEMVYGEGGRSR